MKPSIAVITDFVVARRFFWVYNEPKTAKLFIRVCKSIGKCSFDRAPVEGIYVKGDYCSPKEDRKGVEQDDCYN